MFTQSCQYSKNHEIAHFKRVDFIVCKLHFHFEKSNTRTYRNWCAHILLARVSTIKSLFFFLRRTEKQHTVNSCNFMLPQHPFWMYTGLSHTRSGAWSPLIQFPPLTLPSPSSLRWSIPISAFYNCLLVTTHLWDSQRAYLCVLSHWLPYPAWTAQIRRSDSTEF